MRIWIVTTYLKSSGKYAGKSEKLTSFLSPLAHLSKETPTKKNKCFCKMAVIATKKAKFYGSLILFICFLVSRSLTHLTHPE